jgi:hypothetical protein
MDKDNDNDMGTDTDIDLELELEYFYKIDIWRYSPHSVIQLFVTYHGANSDGTENS